MYSSSEIQTVARKIHNEDTQLRTYENRFKGELGYISKWWQGNASKSFAESYHEIGYEINRLYSDLNNLEEGLRRLALEVQRADDERRRMEAEKKRMLQTKNRKTI